ncbi:DUF2752 domain-containing protein [Kaistella palustris]|uniref:DUF2752 domain-containing protein n=1 Tax=Kaistella palustris TaxID=493376 RepID=UPI00146A411D
MFVFYFYDPANSALFPKCPFKYITGFSCPGCGSQRALHEILHFNFLKVFEYNALLIFSLPYILTGFAFNFNVVKNRFPNARKFLFGQQAIIFVLLVVFIFSVLRNL